MSGRNPHAFVVDLLSVTQDLTRSIRFNLPYEIIIVTNNNKTHSIFVNERNSERVKSTLRDIFEYFHLDETKIKAIYFNYLFIENSLPEPFS